MDDNTIQDPTAMPQGDPMTTPNPAMPGTEGEKPGEMPAPEGEAAAAPEAAPTE